MKVIDGKLTLLDFDSKIYSWSAKFDKLPAKPSGQKRGFTVKKTILIFAFSILLLTARVQAQGTDIGVQINNEIASLPTVTQNLQTWAQGMVTIPAGNYTLSTTIVINSPYIDLHCEQGAILTYTGSGDAIRILPSAQISGAAPTQPN